MKQDKTKQKNSQITATTKTKQKISTQASAWLKTICILQNGHRMAAHNNSNFDHNCLSEELLMENSP